MATARRVPIAVPAACACALWATMAGCTVERSPAAGSRFHAQGWAEKGSAAFHATTLRARRPQYRPDRSDPATAEPLGECKACHGSDYAGGPIGVGCRRSGACHDAKYDVEHKGPAWCGTCHGDGTGPRPTTGAHASKHAAWCDTCHVVPDRMEAAGHLDGDGVPEVTFSGMAKWNGADPKWDRAAGTCTGVYCHGGRRTPAWQGGAIACGDCHDVPPASHARWKRVATQATCGTCHPDPTADTRHRDGTVELLLPPGCDTCHGSNSSPVPPVALDGSTDPTSPGVGAHRRHLDATLPDRISKAVACPTCHVVPANVLDPGHLDATPPADVVLPAGGAYAAGAQTCAVWCHFGKQPGPVWTDSSGKARACDGCHGFPPVLTRKGTVHPIVAGDLAVCLKCHVFGPATHVDGAVEFLP